MTSAEILTRLDNLGVSVHSDGLMILLEPGTLVPPALIEEIREHKPELISALVSPSKDSHAVVGRLQEGQRWLVDQHNRWLSGDPSAATDEEFSRVWNGWWDLDQILRLDHEYVGCIYGQDGHCPDGFPCLGCCASMSPGVVAQLVLMDVDG